MDQLVLLAGQHAKPELLDHLSLYQGAKELLSWHDAFANILLVSCAVPEKLVAQFAADLGLKYQ
jgi:phosphoserine phosphatase